MRSSRLVPLGVTGAVVGLVASGLTASAAEPDDLLANGSFEEPALAAESWTLLGSLPGWTRTRTECPIELQSHVAPGAGTPGEAHHGTQIVELDSTCSGGIQQVASTEPGLRYAIQYAYSPRPAGQSDSGSFENNRLLVSWDGALVDEQQRASTTTTTAWTTHEVLAVAAGTSSVLAFRDGATHPDAVDDSLGVYLDDVSLTPRYDLCRLGQVDKAHKAGSTAPIRLQLCDTTGDNLSSGDLALHALGVRKVDDTAEAMVEDAGQANPDDDFRYDADLAGYIFNLSTKGLTSGTWQLRFTVGGGNHVYTVEFDVR